MNIDRRNFLKLSGTGIAGVFILPLVQGCEGHLVTPLVEPKAEPFVTPTSQFFLQNGGEGGIPGWTQPVFNTESDWSLVVKKQNTTVDTVTFSDLMDIAAGGEEITMLKTIECVLQGTVRVSPTGYTGNAYWTGIPLRRVVEAVDLATVQTLILTAADRFTNKIPVERITEAESMGLIEPLLVYKMNGEPLPPEHGFPVRLIIQEGYGYMNVKWLTEVQAVNIPIENFDGFGTYPEQGFSDEGIMAVNSRATSLFDMVQVSAGPSMIFGFAVSGRAPIEKVEISIDGGVPEEAELVPLDELTPNLPPNIVQLMEGEDYPFRAVWTPWRFQWEASRGEHTIAIRAFDKEGNFQPDTDTTGRDGLNGLTTYRVNVS